jgi:SAM-dependent methyltransferase
MTARGYDQLKDFRRLYREQGAYHQTARGFRAWFLEDNYRAIASRCGADDLVLDLACGEGCLAPYLRARRLAGIDYSPEALDLCRRLHPGAYAELYLGDLRRLEDVPIAGSSLTVVACSLSLMYLLGEDFDRCLRVLHGWLAPGGRLVTTYPTVSERRAPSPEAAELSPDQLAARVTAAGYLVEEMVPFCPLLPRGVVEASMAPAEAEVATARAAYEEARAEMTLLGSYHFLCQATRPDGSGSTRPGGPRAIVPGNPLGGA